MQIKCCVVVKKVDQFRGTIVLLLCWVHARGGEQSRAQESDTDQAGVWPLSPAALTHYLVLTDPPTHLHTAISVFSSIVKLSYIYTGTGRYK